MRVISGKYRGRKLECPLGDGIRPTTDRVKENIFNIIADRVPYSRFLDLFSGSGGIGIEALSRSAEEVVFVDRSTESISALRKNLNTLKVTENVRIIERNVEEAIRMLSMNEVFDIIYMDPPYHVGLYQETMKILSEVSILSDDGIIIVERFHEDPPNEGHWGFELYRTRKYGTIVLDFYRKA